MGYLAVFLFLVMCVVMFIAWLFESYCNKDQLHFYYSPKADYNHRNMITMNPTAAAADRNIITDDGLKSYTFCTSNFFHRRLYKWKDKVYVGKFKRDDIIINGIHHKTGEPYKTLDN